MSNNINHRLFQAKFGKTTIISEVMTNAKTIVEPWELRKLKMQRIMSLVGVDQEYIKKQLLEIEILLFKDYNFEKNMTEKEAMTLTRDDRFFAILKELLSEVTKKD